MRELNLSEQYALIALEGQESLHSSVAKSAVLRAVTAAEVLMPVCKSKDVLYLNLLKKRRKRYREQYVTERVRT